MTRRPHRLEEGDSLVLRTVEIIGYLRPRWWAIENPRSGLLKTRSFMKVLPFDDVTYCQYGYRYRKATRIWNNLPWRPSRPVCCNARRCEVFNNGRHAETAQRQGGKERIGQNRDQLYSIPPRLCEEIAAERKRACTSATKRCGVKRFMGRVKLFPTARVHVKTATRRDRSPRAVHWNLPRAEQIGEDGGVD